MSTQENTTTKTKAAKAKSKTAKAKKGCDSKEGHEANQGEASRGVPI